jgi:hypothetical protein
MHIVLDSIIKKKLMRMVLRKKINKKIKLIKINQKIINHKNKILFFKIIYILFFNIIKQNANILK